MINKEYVHGSTINYQSDEDHASSGIYYLNNLSSDECKVLFDQARAKGEAAFKNSDGYHFSLLYKGDEYILMCK